MFYAVGVLIPRKAENRGKKFRSTPPLFPNFPSDHSLMVERSIFPLDILGGELRERAA